MFIVTIKTTHYPTIHETQFSLVVSPFRFLYASIYIFDSLFQFDLFFPSMNCYISDSPRFIWFSVIIMNLLCEEYCDIQKYFLVAK